MVTTKGLGDDAEDRALAHLLAHGLKRSLVLAAQHYLSRFGTAPPCRFDVVAIDGDALDWLRAAFDAG